MTIAVLIIPCTHDSPGGVLAAGMLQLPLPSMRNAGLQAAPTAIARS